MIFILQLYKVDTIVAPMVESDYALKVYSNDT